MSESDEIAVVASSLRREYHVGDITIEALKGLNLEVAEGEFVTIHGPSGAGKTTFLNIIGGLDKPTSGEIVVFGHNLLACDEDFLATFRCAYIGFVFQSYNLISTLTALENVAFPVEIAGWEGKRASERSKKLLEIVGLSHRANHFPSQLSGGEQQRVAFARALANDPPLLLVDEPTGNLDLETSLEIVHILERLKAEKKTIIVATHDARIMQLANRTLELRNGKIVV
ncbi:MAG: ABC transporter ATP-binding protein [Candidatus Bathyarchaeia archaeon]